MEKKTFKVMFPFSGQVKTQMRIATKKNGKSYLFQPNNVKRFETSVRTILMYAFPLEKRPIQGYLRFDMHHYTQFKRDKEGLIVPTKKGDLDNIFKTLADCFEPIYRKRLKYEKDGVTPVLKKNGDYTYEKFIVTEGVIRNDKYIMKGQQHWIPVHTEEEERLEVFITVLTEEELFIPPSLPYEVVDLTP